MQGSTSERAPPETSPEPPEVFSSLTTARPNAAPLEFVLHLADNALMLAQRNAQWCGHAPVLEEDIAQANISLDLLGQARYLYQHAAHIRGGDATEDTLAYFRDASEFRNLTLLELPHEVPDALPGTVSNGTAEHQAHAKNHSQAQAQAQSQDASQGHPHRDYAVTIVRNYLFSAFMVLRWDALVRCPDLQLAAIAERALKETRYHLRHSRDWLIRLGDGTAQSRQRMQAALDFLMPYTAELWADSDFENAASASGVCEAAATWYADWNALIQSDCATATLTAVVPERTAAASPEPGPGDTPSNTPSNGPGNALASTPDRPSLDRPGDRPAAAGKHGYYSLHRVPLLAEMQSLARAHPGATW